MKCSGDMLVLFLDDVKEALQCCDKLYICLLPEIHGAAQIHQIFSLFCGDYEIKAMRFSSLLWMTERQGGGYAATEKQLSLEEYMNIRQLTIHTTVCLLDMFTEHASSSFHSYSCLFRQGYHKELQAPYVIITIFIIYMWTTTKSQIIMQMSYNHFMFMQILC